MIPLLPAVPVRYGERI
jgi:hypothetical protein